MNLQKNQKEGFHYMDIKPKLAWSISFKKSPIDPYLLDDLLVYVVFI